MGQVSVTLNGRTFRLRCGDGEEERLLRVVAHVRGHVDKLISEHGQIGDERLILMAAILITDEMFELREQQRMGTVPSAPVPSPPTSSPLPAAAPPQPMAPLQLPRALVAPPRAAVSPRDVQAPAVRSPLAAGGIPAAVNAVRPAPVVTPPTLHAPAPSPPPLPAVPTAPLAGAAAPAVPPRPIEHLDATALMKGVELKNTRG